MSAASPTTTLPTRSNTDVEDAIPDEDSSEVTRLFHERLQAWKHACGYLEDYIAATEKMQSQHGKEYEKVLKTVNQPLKEGNHFDQQLGGIAGLFDNIRSNTQGVSTSHYETAKTIKGSVLPIFERLHSELKSKTKELVKGAGKGAKAVDKARASSQKHIEFLGQYTAAYDSSAGSIKAADDPYIVQRQVYHRLNKQVQEENNNRDDMIAVQNSFSQFEAHVVQTFQQGLQQFNSVIQNQAEQTRNMYGDIAATAQRIPPLFEWERFVQRNNEVLIDPNAPKRNLENIAFANQDHKATQPLIAGSLERKGKVMKSYSAAYYVVTPSKYLHEFKTDDDFAKDPTPENSLYLPDCVVGSLDGLKFNVKGKDASKGALGSKLSLSHEFAFKAHTPEDAKKWHDVIASVAGLSSNETLDSTPSSPVVDNSTSSPVGTQAEIGTIPAASTAGTTTTAGQTAATEKPTMSTA